MADIAAAVVVRPSEKLLVVLDRDATADEAARYRRDLEERLPGVEVVVLSGARQLAVYRSDGDGNA